ncbi:MAG: hypothetical protein ACSHXB_07535 [Sulfitobacter sp.]
MSSLTEKLSSAVRMVHLIERDLEEACFVIRNPKAHGGRDVLNKTHGWADPMKPDRARDFKPMRESADHAEARKVSTAFPRCILLGMVSKG